MAAVCTSRDALPTDSQVILYEYQGFPLQQSYIVNVTETTENAEQCIQQTLNACSAALVLNDLTTPSTLLTIPSNFRSA